MKKDLFDYIWTDKKRTLFGLPLSFTRYFLTETKFITRKGFLSVEEDELELYKVTDKKLVMPFGQRIFGCATIVLHVRNDVDTPANEPQYRTPLPPFSVTRVFFALQRQALTVLDCFVSTVLQRSMADMSTVSMKKECLQRSYYYH